MLQSSIRQTLNSQQAYRKVSSVNCRPHVQDVAYSDGYVHLNCAVRFNDGSSYSTAATIEARSFEVTGYNFAWDGPGQADITKSPPPRPPVTAAGSPSQSLLSAVNLTSAIHTLRSHLHRGDLILQLVIYPGVLQAVVGSDGTARLVTIHAGGSASAGPGATFAGSRSGIELSQLLPQVVQNLSARVAKHAGPVDRLVLVSLPGENAGWRIYPVSGSTYFQALVLGENLESVSPSGKRTRVPA
jgi:hypothetical protein